MEQGREITGSGAIFSACRRYRYELWRRWNERAPLVFIGLNPSTADETADDPTIRRCIAFARRENFGGMIMLNLFAWRSTEPDALLRVRRPIGPRNDSVIGRWLREGPCIACWGGHRASVDRAADVLRMAVAAGQALRCLGLTHGGSPRHPLYLRRDAMLARYDPNWTTGHAALVSGSP